MSLWFLQRQKLQSFWVEVLTFFDLSCSALGRKYAAWMSKGQWDKSSIIILLWLTWVTFVRSKQSMQFDRTTPSWSFIFSPFSFNRKYLCNSENAMTCHFLFISFRFQDYINRNVQNNHTHFFRETPQSARKELISAQNEYAHKFDGNRSAGIYRRQCL